jgi:chloride channel 3/4/5
VLDGKVARLRERGLLDAGLVLVREVAGSERKELLGYIAQGELVGGLARAGGEEVRLLRVEGGGGGDEAGVTDLSPFVDRTPLSVCAQAPMEYVVELFGKLGLRYLMVMDESGGGLVGVVIKKVSEGFFHSYFLRRLLWGETDC